MAAHGVLGVFSELLWLGRFMSVLTKLHTPRSLISRLSSDPEKELLLLAARWFHADSRSKPEARALHELHGKPG